MTIWTPQSNIATLHRREMPQSKIGVLCPQYDPQVKPSLNEVERLIKGYWASESMVGGWLMNEYGSNIVADLSGNNLWCNIGGSPTWVSGPYGPAVDYNGTTDYHISDRTLAVAPEKMTMVVTCKFDDTNKMNPWRVGDSGNSKYIRTNWSTTAIGGYCFDGTNERNPTVSYTYSAGWHTYICAYDFSGGQVKFDLYIDGRYIGQSSSYVFNYSVCTNLLVTWGLSRTGASWTYMDGMISHASMYNRLLTPAEVTSLSQEPFCMVKRRKRTMIITPEIYEPELGVSGSIHIESIDPSSATGYARSKEESANPELWEGLKIAIAPSLGTTGTNLKDYMRRSSFIGFQGSPTWVASKGRRAIAFDGSNDYVQLISYLYNQLPFTISCWFRKTGDNSLSTTLLSPYNGVDQTTNFWFNMGTGATNGQVGTGVWDGTSWYGIDSSAVSTSYDDGEWHLAVSQIEGTKIHLWVDGIYCGNNTHDGAIPCIAATWGYGASGTGGDKFLGDLGDVNIWNRALTKNDILKLYEDPKALWRLKPRAAAHIKPVEKRPIRPAIILDSYDPQVKPSPDEVEGLIEGHWASENMVAGWLMNEYGCRQIVDLSGNKNNGTFVQSPTWIVGPDGSAINFVQANPQPYIDFGSNSILDNMPAFTIAIRFRPDVCDTSYDILFGKYSESGSVKGWQISITDNWDGTIPEGLQFFRQTSGAAQSWSAPANTLHLGQWATLVLVCPLVGTVPTVYYGDETTPFGLLAGTTAAGGGAAVDDSSVNFWLGTGTGGGGGPIVSAYDGAISWCHLWNRVLPTEEIIRINREPFCMVKRRRRRVYFEISRPFSLPSEVEEISVRDYTRGDVVALPSDDTDLENAFTDSEYTQVESDDASRVAQTATGEFAAFLFKDKNTAEETIVVEWNGQSDRAPSDSTVYLQIYNRNTPAWETLDSDSTTGADTDFTLSGQVTSNLSYYFDANNWIACRVYQEAK